MKALLSFFEPFILMLLATVALASFLPAQGQWRDVVSIVANAAIVLLFFLHGAKLSRQAIIDGARHWPLHLAGLGLTFGLFPLIGLAFAQLPLFDGSLRTGILFLAVLPSTVQSSIAFTAMARGNVAAAVCSASFSNLVGIFLTPLLVALLIHADGPAGISWDAARTIILQLLLPFIAGHVLRPVIGGFVARHKPLVTVVDRGSILLVVYSAFGAAVLNGIWTMVNGSDLLALGALSLTQLAIVLVLAWNIGKWLGFKREDRIVLLFCGSKKSLASGVPMAGVLFPAATVGLVILPLMLFHQIQLIICAVLARRLGEEPPAAHAPLPDDSGIAAA
ncbi:bile acid:sodium symporter [Sphingobium terrigena]|uniref:Bile acid:sodium symporter n=1 Tax=Sphingobium terrigena TaxID=2304063 RepID=A0A418YMP1_9SPHN|nr:bile acid:sodium symporter family protein [Sphingobium terrigena]PZU59273.1 MAG: bile acid:sodium symporter [Sphingobium sp.]RJG52437.1 bile acid:sodium symporter [Sphingobium terrigena]